MRKAFFHRGKIIVRPMNIANDKISPVTSKGCWFPVSPALAGKNMEENRYLFLNF